MYGFTVKTLKSLFGVPGLMAQLCFDSSFVLMHTWEATVLIQIVGCLSSIWQTWTEFSVLPLAWSSPAQAIVSI